MNEITGKAKSIRELLFGERYYIDYYQREYKWGSKQISELINDLHECFDENYDETHELSEVAKYGNYYLGSVIISDKQGDRYIVDGQQRITTITLLLIFLNNLQRSCSENERVSLTELIFSNKFGKHDFNISVDDNDRIACMDALLNQKDFNRNEISDAVHNIFLGYEEIENSYPDDLRKKALTYFIYWLIEKVYFVEITAGSDEDAYKIFETMNDRGLSLSATDMLKGYLLANISDAEKRNQANDLIKKRLDQLIKISKDDPADFIKAWLRSQYAKNIRPRIRNAKPGDFDRQGTEFHRWVHDNAKELGLVHSSDFHNWITQDFDFYSRLYHRVREMSLKQTTGFEDIFYIARQGFTLQYTLLLAPITPKDDDATINRKLKIVAAYIDIYLNRRIWNYRTISYSTLQYTLFNLMLEIRQKSPEELVEILTKKLVADPEKFTSNERFSLHMMNRPYIHRILARMTDFIEQQLGKESHYREYANIVISKKDPYEVEHIWANIYSDHTDEFVHIKDFEEYRNRIGGLLLLPKSFNQSFGKLPYEEKVEKYFGQNYLAKSFYSACYDRDPKFRTFLESTGLPFKSFDHFEKASLEERQQLYISLAELVWNPKRLEAVIK